MVAISETGSVKQVQPADTSRHDAVDRCSDGMQMTVVVAVAVVWKMVEERADEQTCWDGGSGAEKKLLEPASTVPGPYPRRHVC